MGLGAVIQKGEAMTERVTPTTLSFTISPMVLLNAGLPVSGWSKYGTGHDWHTGMLEIGNGSMTAHSREEVARITRRLGGRMKP